MILKAHRERIWPNVETALTPMQVAKAYGFPSDVDLSKRTIAILEFGGAYQQADVVAYCQQYGLKMPTITNVFLDGAALGPPDPNGADGEVCLDIDIVAGVAQGCKILVIFAPNSEQGFADAVSKAVELDVDAISCSWGAPESNWSETGRLVLDAAIKSAAEIGIPVLCASGDNGSSDGQTFGNVTDYPACSPYAIACGGTTLSLSADGSIASETAWSTSLLENEGSGGGISSIYPIPDWQKGVLPDQPTGRRSPDVSGNANPTTGYIVNIDGDSAQVGGTSAVAPLYAAIQCILNAKANAHVGNLHTKFYANPTAFNPITEGTNGAYKCNEDGSYSCVTGLGSPNAEKLLAVLTAK